MWNTFSSGSYHYQRLFFICKERNYLLVSFQTMFLYKSSNTVQEISGFDVGITVGMVTPYVEK